MLTPFLTPEAAGRVGAADGRYRRKLTSDRSPQIGIVWPGARHSPNL